MEEEEEEEEEGGAVEALVWQLQTCDNLDEVQLCRRLKHRTRSWEHSKSTRAPAAVLIHTQPIPRGYSLTINCDRHGPAPGARKMMDWEMAAAEEALR